MQKMRLLAALLRYTGILCTLALETALGGCRTSVSGVQLANHVMSNLTIGDVDTCYRTCSAKLGCRSINYYRDKSLCELNSRTIENTPEMTVINEDSVYFKIPADGHIIMSFPKASVQNKAVLENCSEPLKAFTVCSWNQPTSKSEQALFSYATYEYHNEIFVQLEQDKNNNTFLRVYLLSWKPPNGEAKYVVDGNWHHFCLTWENNHGELKIYIDGVMKDKGTRNPGRVISGKGAVVLGQDQDKVKGGYQVAQSYQGNLTNVNLWDRVLTPEEVTDLSRSCSVGEGNVIMWSDFTARIEGNIKLLRSYHDCGK